MKFQKILSNIEYIQFLEIRRPVNHDCLTVELTSHVLASKRMLVNCSKLRKFCNQP